MSLYLALGELSILAIAGLFLHYGILHILSSALLRINAASLVIAGNPSRECPSPCASSMDRINSAIAADGEGLA